MSNNNEINLSFIFFLFCLTRSNPDNEGEIWNKDTKVRRVLMVFKSAMNILIKRTTGNF